MILPNIAQQELILHALFSLLVTVISAGLVYSYFANGWTDPNEVTLLAELTSLAELACLSIFALGGLANAVRVIRKLCRR